MLKEIRMPNLGTNVDEMKIVRWLKAAGDEVRRGEMLFEVETDKATMEVESYLAGYLKKIAVKEGDFAAVGGVVAYIGEKDDSAEPAVEAQCKTPAAQAVPGTEGKAPGQIRISPMVKKIAEELKVDYTKISGSGPNGMITKQDVEIAAVKSKAAPQTERLESFNRIAKATARAMSLSKSTIPHVYFETEIEASAMKALRERSGKAVSYNAMIVKAVADCLKQYPYLAAAYSAEGRILKPDMHIGLAVANGGDLFVPVIKSADGKTVAEIENEIGALTDKARNGTLAQEDISGGVFTVTNLGSFGITAFAAVINPPEAAILALGAISPKAVPDGTGVSFMPVLRMTLSADHRVVNGAYAAEFLKELKSMLERMG